MMYTYKTKKGSVVISEDGNRFYVRFAGEDLGNYATAEQAAEDVTWRHASKNVDFEKLDVPRDLSEWKKI